MKSNAAKKLLLAAAVASAIGVSGSHALADSAVDIFNNDPGETSETGITYDNASGNYPVITAILSQLGTVNGHTYSSWAVLANDGTGSIELYGTMPDSYTPTVGDAIVATGEYYPYHQIPELEDLSSISLISQGNSVPSPLTETVSSLNVTALPQSIAGYLIQVNDVTISSGTSTLTPDETWGTANLTLTMTDSSGDMTLYYYPTSYSTANENLYGETIPTGPVDVIGIDSVYNSTSPEFIPIGIIPAPEPSELAMFGVGGLLLLTPALRRRKGA